MKLRRASALVCYWEDGEFVIRNYLTNGQVVATGAIIRLLDAVSKAVDWNSLLSLASFLPRAPEVLSLLRSETILLVDGSTEDLKDKAVREKWVWGHDAKCFHYGTQHVDFSFDTAKIRAFFERKALTDPPPSPFKRCKGPLQELPPPQVPLGYDFWDVLSKRRTCRTFNAELPVSVESLSQILKIASGLKKYYNNSRLDQRIIKTSPSGGARHPIETYVIARNVTSIKKGVYHYSVKDHRLVSIAKAPGRRRLIKVFGGQTWLADTAAIFIFSAVLARSMWKYDHSRAYRVITLDAGHLAQTLLLVGTALGLGVFSTAAFDDKSLEMLIGVNGVEDVVIYCCAIGYALPAAQR
jgi:SagB-type dehydrogenase family enzyme